MKLIWTQPASARAAIHVVLGSGGLIGSELVARLTTSQVVWQEDLPMHWSQPDVCASDLQRLASRVSALVASLRTAGGVMPRINWLWAAGKAGFRCTTEQANGELDRFEAVLNCAADLAKRYEQTDPVFAMTSSAGGVFEGGLHIHADASPAPRRPYGHLKLAQERALLQCDAPIAKQVYRLTSVYGPPTPGSRRGLITAMLFNGMRQQVTPIFGRLDTLRDFTFTGDIARHICQCVSDPAPGDTIQFLAACRPTAIYEVRVCVEEVLNHPIYVACSIQTTNDRNITFAQDTRPAGWYANTLEQNVRQIYVHALSNGIHAG